jgi:CheY-like chemotaxis protein
MRSSPAAAPDAQPLPSAAPALLVVDDDRLVRSVVVHVLRLQGYEVLEAADAEAALTALGSHPGRVGAVLTDDRMPGMSGRELAAVVARVYPGVRIVLMSGESPDPEGEPLSEAVNAVLSKPFSLRRLLETVSWILR